MNPDRSVAHLKARLVARGYSQTYSVDFRDPFSCIQNVWLFDFLSLLLFIQLALHYSDVKDAFLRGDSFEEVYMEQPIGFVAQEETRMELS